MRYFTGLIMLFRRALFLLLFPIVALAQINDVEIIQVYSFSSGPYREDDNALVNNNGNVYFQAFDALYGNELWGSDGSNAGTYMVKDIFPGNPLGGTHVSSLNSLNGMLFFIADNNQGFGYEVWVSDGTSTGTFMLVDANPGSLSTFYSAMASFNNMVLFSSWRSLWRTDGTEIGTELIFTIPGGDAQRIQRIIPFNGQAIVHNSFALWNTNGTASGTFLIKEWQNFAAISMILFKNKLVIAAEGELWESDGSIQNTMLLKDINSGVGLSQPDLFTKGSNLLLFMANDGVHGRELWKTDGTFSGTELVKDMTPGFSSSDISNIIALDNDNFMFVKDNTSLFRTDGTDSGTVLVKVLSRAIINSVYFQERTFFATTNDLWMSDGTDQGTVIVAPLDIPPAKYLAIDDTLYFLLDGDVYTFGSSLWRLQINSQTSVAEDNTGRIKSFHVAQNYPNPFNPTTVINYQLPKRERVSISIFDITGKLVKNLVNEFQEAGNHSTIWNAEGFSSGIYLYKIDAGEFQTVKKCILLK